MEADAVVRAGEGDPRTFPPRRLVDVVQAAQVRPQNRLERHVDRDAAEVQDV